ncbi:hypothetical protein GS597_18480 [Synechococcales cyanobacterium C]|uniref:N-acetyltransferase domain-containing protein n=1 Tax=Petrachloros mirabilis ULC683 TaxID=2781853 RepID=A0A8K2A2B2_9CYAN|nr:hypothetical protein [Petrachloros mirabilis]NCJ08456.1 hypothetical protein [Petrachloros mirabilis ULC683]
MVSIQKIKFQDFDKVRPILSEFQDSEVNWKSIFDYPWNTDKDFCGYGLFDNNDIVGFIGLIFSQRIIDFQLEKFCNIHSWIIKEKYRNYGVFMAQSIGRLKNYTLTDVTPSESVCKIFEYLGFKELDSKLSILLIMPWQNFNQDKDKRSISFSTSKDEISTILNSQDFQIFEDHQPYLCHHLVAHYYQEYCYLVYSSFRQNKISYCHIQYISNSDFFARNSLKIRHKIFQKNKTPFILTDHRFIKEMMLPFTYTLPLEWKKIYRSNTLSSEQIDNLYTENIILNLSNIPELREIFHRLIKTLKF